MTVTATRRFFRLLAIASFAVLLAACYPAEATQAPVGPGTSVGVPASVVNRTPLMECGIETLKAGASDDTGYDQAGRECFVNANADGREAEFITAYPRTTTTTSTVTVYVTTYYRTFKDKHVEVIMDGRNSAEMGYKWSAQKCTTLEVQGGEPISFNGKSDTCTDMPLN